MLYKLDITDVAQSERIKIAQPNDVGVTEKNIEDFLMSRLHEIVSEDGLMLIGKERSGQEEPDLLAIDKSGVLYLFELKRWTSESENLLQVMRYAQIFGRYAYPKLAEFAQRQVPGDLRETHKSYFELNEPLPETKFNNSQVLVLVTNGLDRDTISAVEFWTKKGVRIDCAPYRVYEIEGNPYIQFDTYDPERETVVEENPGTYIVNTNKTYLPDAWRDMIADGRSGKASAYGDRRNAIRRITKYSVVYLYHTGVGVIAKGRSTSDFEPTDYDGEAGMEFYVPLVFDWALRNPKSSRQWQPECSGHPDEHEAASIKAWEVNRRLGTSHRFRQTVFAIGQSMADEIDALYEEKQGGGSC